MDERVKCIRGKLAAPEKAIAHKKIRKKRGKLKVIKILIKSYQEG